MARETIEISAKQMVVLLAHLQANVLFQRRLTEAVASIAAGNPEWDALEEIAGLTERSGEILDSFIFDIAERKSKNE